MASGKAAEAPKKSAGEETRRDVRIGRAKAGGGGKLSRSETVTVRLDPKLNYLCELAARAQRRTKSSFVEWAIDHALESIVVPGTSPEQTVAGLISSLWDVEEADRLAMLAFTAPFLMTHEEQVIWKLIESNGLLWRGQYSTHGDGEWTWSPVDRFLRWDVLRQYYETFKAVAEGTASKDDLPRWTKTKPRPTPAAFDSDLDDECPF